MLTLYRKLLRLYPAEHRELFGEEMIAVLREEIADNTNKKLMARGRFFAREISGVVTGALRQHLRVWFEVREGLSLVTGRLAMRNGFRFPKTTIVFMTLILACVVTAIKRGEDIAASVPNVDPPLPIHIQPVHSILLGGLPLFFAFFYTAGLIGWAILFALRRSGVHRLADMSGDQK
ncbi:MAG TPA: hypothetical protein VE377_12705 [Candidatus Dormibacteraeota bacterium]|nr:hypothetical protein [Candidatus Dormibacteraeota bacterium]